MTDVCTRIAMARTRFDNLRHLWNDKCLHLNLRLRLYKSCVQYTDLRFRGLVHRRGNKEGAKWGEHRHGERADGQDAASGGIKKVEDV